MTNITTVVFHGKIVPKSMSKWIFAYQMAGVLGIVRTGPLHNAYDLKHPLITAY